MKKIIVEAKKDNLDDVLAQVDSILEEMECPMKGQMKIDIAVEEIFVNIASYAYGDGTGEAEIEIDDTTPAKITITFIDSGVEFNPLEKEDPDVTLSAEDRSIGGLGILMVKKSMDEVSYKRENGKNIFSITYCWD